MSRGLTRAERLRQLEKQYLYGAYTDEEMAALMGVESRTTIYKDRQLLTSHGVPFLEIERGRWKINRQKYISELRVNVHEAAMLYLMARRAVRQTYMPNPHLTNVLRKIALTLHQPLMDRLITTTNFIPESEGAVAETAVLEKIVTCWVEERKVRIRYQGLQSQKTTIHLVSPYLLEPSLWGEGIYLVGFSETMQQIVPFKLNRIDKAADTTQPIIASDTFDEQEFVRNVWSIWDGDGELVTVKLRFRGETAVRRVQESVWHPNQSEPELLPNGDLIWTTQVAEWREMLPWVRGWGANLEVLEPEGLRSEIKRHVQRLNKIYGLSMLKERAAIAHSLNDYGERHPLVSHLQAVADMAGQFAEPLQATELAHYLGLWHDLGKFHPDFQQYLLDAEAGIRRRGPDHKAAGVRITKENQVDYLGLLLQGHHGGLKNKTELQRWYQQCKGETETALSLAKEEIDFRPATQLTFPSFAETRPLSAEFFLRMLFSTLVDADFLDTEAHFNPDKSIHRGSTIEMATLWQRFEADQKHRFADAPETTVNRSRQEIYDACIAAATQSTGLFRLTVPTGGGKTRSGIAFALRHALEHEQRRILIAVPYITITQQTAGVYRSIFNNDEDEEPAVLEHHSGVTEQSDMVDHYDPRVIWQRLAAENWDAPIIVTTTVQLFESLFANSTSRCRKLHRLANSIIILDEAQSLPAHLLAPILDGLRELCANYGSTVVLSTATQPAFDTFKPFQELNAREIVTEPERHFQTLKRVNYQWRVNQPLSWPEVADLMRSETQALAICNTKQDALDLLDALDDPNALHLSTLLCGAHRTVVIAEVKRRLNAGKPCRLVATQVVEAGVDIDFPLVLRALGPLDSIVQAAGRANREGKLDRGRVIIFQPADGGMPPGAYQRAAKTTITLLNSGPLDMHDPTTMQQYFRKLYQLEDTDSKEIQARRQRLDYPEIARRFRLIENETISVIVTGYGSAEEQQRLRNILDRLRHGAPPTRRLMRQLQPYTISLWQHQANKYLNQGFLSPQDNDGIPPGIWEWNGQYDKVRGLSADINADKLIF